MSPETVMRDWKLAKAWLLRELEANKAAMTPERWQQISRIYHAALARDSRRAARVSAAGLPGDDALRHEVESLLDTAVGRPLHRQRAALAADPSVRIGAS